MSALRKRKQLCELSEKLYISFIASREVQWCEYRTDLDRLDLLEV